MSYLQKLLKKSIGMVSLIILLAGVAHSAQYLRITSDRSTIMADGQDRPFITISLEAEPPILGSVRVTLSVTEGGILDENSQWIPMTESCSPTGTGEICYSTSVVTNSIAPDGGFTHSVIMYDYKKNGFSRGSIGFRPLRAISIRHYRGPITLTANAPGFPPASVSFSVGTPPPPPDTTPPTITQGPEVRNITANSAEIFWVTNELSNSILNYNIRSILSNKAKYPKIEQIYFNNMVTEHVVQLRNLQQGTIYEYEVRSVDAARNVVASNNHFQTLSPPPSTPPTFQITSPVQDAHLVRGTSHILRWTSHGTAPTVMIRLKKGDFFLPRLVDEMPNTGSWTWNIPSTLETGSNYSILISNINFSDNIGTVRFSIVATPHPPPPDRTAPRITNPAGYTIVTYPNNSVLVNIAWVTDEPSDSSVDLGLSPTFNSGWIPKTDATLTTNHLVSLGGLQLGKLYYFRVRSKDAAGNEVTSEISSFQTQNPTPNFTVTSPMEGESLIKGNTCKIKWRSNGLNVSPVQIDLYQSGVFKGTLNSQVSNWDKWTWIISAETGSNYKIRIFNSAYPDNWADSGNFNIVPRSRRPGWRGGQTQSQ